MSADTRAALEAAIAAHLAAEDGSRILSDWAIVARTQQIDNDISRYQLITPDIQAFHVTEGLIAVGRRVLDDIWDDPEG